MAGDAARESRLRAGPTTRCEGMVKCGRGAGRAPSEGRLDEAFRAVDSCRCQRQQDSRHSCRRQIRTPVYGRLARGREGTNIARSWTLKSGGWYRTFLDDPLGTIQVGDRHLRVRAAKAEANASAMRWSARTPEVLDESFSEVPSAASGRHEGVKPRSSFNRGRATNALRLGTDPTRHRLSRPRIGRPVHDDRVWFEFLLLEGAQAGLSWETILNKRDAYRKAFDDFAPERVARYTPARIERLLQDPGIVRNRLKVQSAIGNAKAFLAVQREFGSFDAYVWQFVDGSPLINRRRTIRDVPARTPESDALSRDLSGRGFKFVGSTICYAFMQATGLVNNHTLDAFGTRRLRTRTKRAISHAAHGVIEWRIN